MTGLILYEKLIFQATSLGSCRKLTPIEIILNNMLMIGVRVAVLTFVVSSRLARCRWDFGHSGFRTSDPELFFTLESLESNRQISCNEH